jgi:hypothetical protein
MHVCGCRYTALVCSSLPQNEIDVLAMFLGLLSPDGHHHHHGEQQQRALQSRLVGWSMPGGSKEAHWLPGASPDDDDDGMWQEEEEDRKDQHVVQCAAGKSILVFLFGHPLCGHQLVKQLHAWHLVCSTAHAAVPVCI